MKKYFKYRDPEGIKLLIKEDEDAIYHLLDVGMEEFRLVGQVYISESLKQWKVVPSPKVSVGAGVSSGWLELSVDMGDLQNEELSKILAAYSQKKKYYRLKSGQFLKLEEGGEILIKGAQGITGTPQAATFTIGVILVLITLFIVMNLVHSRTGRAIMAIRDNRIAAESIGINITKYKLLAFSISAGLAGVAGVLYAHNLTTLTAQPKNFGYNMSIMILVYVVLGGIGSIRGSVIATVILYLLPEMLRGLSNYRMLMYAIVLILAMLFNSAPQFVVMRERLAEKFSRKDKKPAKEAA